MTRLIRHVSRYEQRPLIRIIIPYRRDQWSAELGPMSVHIGQKRAGLWMWARSRQRQPACRNPAMDVPKPCVLGNLNRPEGMQIENEFFLLLASCTTTHVECGRDGRND